LRSAAIAGVLIAAEFLAWLLLSVLLALVGGFAGGGSLGLQLPEHAVLGLLGRWAYGDRRMGPWGMPDLHARPVGSLGRAQLRCTHALGHRLRVDEKRKGEMGQAAGGIGDTASILGEEAAEFVARLSRWSGEVVQALSSDEWYTSVAIGHVARAPLHRFMCWLQAESADQGRGELANQRPPAVVQLTTARASALMDAFSDLLQEAAWAGQWLLVVQNNPQRQIWRAEALLVVLHAAVDAYRRLVLPATGYPLKLSWLVLAKPDERHGYRAQICKEILAGRSESLRDSGVDTLSELLRSRFAGELRAAADGGGTLCPDLHRFILATWRAQHRGAIGPSGLRVQCALRTMDLWHGLGGLEPGKRCGRLVVG
jgi:hypothetical protein